MGLIIKREKKGKKWSTKSRLNYFHVKSLSKREEEIVVFMLETRKGEQEEL
jgi:hypothetical protein